MDLGGWGTELGVDHALVATQSHWQRRRARRFGATLPLRLGRRPRPLASPRCCRDHSRGAQFSQH